MLLLFLLPIIALSRGVAGIDVSYASPAYKYCECGRKNRVAAASSHHRIIGGNETLANEYPWMALLIGVDVDATQFLCGGSLLNDRYVLSAAHCLKQEYTQSQIKVVLGEHDRCLPDVRTVTLSIERIVRHPKCRAAADIALIKLNMRVTFNAYVRPICLPKSSPRKPSAALAYGGRTGEILGWGVGDVPSVSCSLRKTRLTVSKRCWKKLPGVFCAGPGERDACVGDSGGPFQVMTGDDGRYELVGIVSSGIGCGDPYAAGLYTDVRHFLPWIYKTTSPDSSYCWR